MAWIFNRRGRSARELGTVVTEISTRVDNVTGQLETVHRGIADIRVLLEGQRAKTTEPQTSHLPKSLDDYSKYVKLLLIAADIATARLNCHRDTWAFLTEKAAPQPQHFRTPGDITDTDGRIETTISGRSLIAVLTALWSIAHRPHSTDAELVDWALAVTLYEQTAGAIERLQHGQQDDDTIVVITIDRRCRDATSQLPELDTAT